ncbi:MAG TPA: DNA-binding domain-containing protein [Casimicrobiaceae bacterium]|nr:DNA-binding domain-containing protein [Casimicrobiaceae bacterium]
MPSLHELQAQFSAALAGDTGHADSRIAIYRNTVSANYRNALGATYRVVRQLVGVPFFNAAVDAYTMRFPSTCGDLNVYGDHFGDFLATYPHAGDLTYLPDVARLEWAIDEAYRAPDADSTPTDLLAALAAVPAERVHTLRFACDPSCRFLISDFPVLRIWQVHQPGFEGDIAVRFGEAADRLLVRREAGGVVVERVAPTDFVLLQSLHRGDDLESALATALASEVDPGFDLGVSLRQFVSSGTLAALRDR